MSGPVEQLTRAIASGDTEAFARFYRSSFDRMYRHARRVTGRDESFCLDVVQDAMIRVIKSMPVMDDQQRLNAWTARVVASCAVDRIRAESRRRRREHTALERRPAPAPPGPNHERWLAEQVARLDPTSAHLLNLRHRLGWSLARIGTAMGLSPGAVDGRIRRTVQRLRRTAQEQIDE